MNTLQIKKERKYRFIKSIFGSYKSVLTKKAPSNWAELNQKQFLSFISILHKYNDNADKAKIKAFQLLYKLNFWNLHWFESDQLHEMIQKVNWIFDEPLTVQLIPRLSYRFKHLYGPGDGLKGYTGYEFIFSDMYFMNYQKSKDEKDLNKFIACLYRKRKSKSDIEDESYDGDQRIAFNPNTIDRRLKIIEKQSSVKKLGILMYYTGCRQQWEKMHPNLFCSESQGEAKNHGWDKVMLRISGKEFGDFDNTLAQPVHNIFRKMDSDIQEYRKSKQSAVS